MGLFQFFFEGGGTFFVAVSEVWYIISIIIVGAVQTVEFAKTAQQEWGEYKTWEEIIWLGGARHMGENKQKHK